MKLRPKKCLNYLIKSWWSRNMHLNGAKSSDTPGGYGIQLHNWYSHLGMLWLRKAIKFANCKLQVAARSKQKYSGEFLSTRYSHTAMAATRGLQETCEKKSPVNLKKSSIEYFVYHLWQKNGTWGQRRNVVRNSHLRNSFPAFFHFEQHISASQRHSGNWKPEGVK